MLQTTIIPKSKCYRREGRTFSVETLIVIKCIPSSFCTLLCSVLQTFCADAASN